MKTPQEKKLLSYAKDRRNTYGENSEASRKGIALTKARTIRSERHRQDTLLAAALGTQGEDHLTQVEGQVKGTPPRRWRKFPDKPLGEVLAGKTTRKRARSGT